MTNTYKQIYFTRSKIEFTQFFVEMFILKISYVTTGNEIT